MINLDQIQSLEQKVIKAVALIKRLREENTALRSRLENTEPKIRELETIVHTYKKDQSAIEKGILGVLSKLDKLEDEVSDPGETTPEQGSAKTVLRNEEEAPTAAPEKETPKAARGDKNKPASQQDSPPPTADKKAELDIF